MAEIFRLRRDTVAATCDTSSISEPLLGLAGLVVVFCDWIRWHWSQLLSLAIHQTGQRDSFCGYSLQVADLLSYQETVSSDGIAYLMN